jgi:dynein heavy chain
MMRVDSKRLKEVIAPSPAVCLEKIEGLLPQLAAQKQRHVLDEVNDANNKLTKKPETVQDFVALLQFIVELNERKEEMEAQFENLKAHYTLMDEHHVHVASMDRAAFQMLVPEYIQMKNMLELLDSTKDEDMGKWGSRLEEDIKGFHTSVDSLQKLAQDPQLLEDHEFLEPVMMLTHDLKEQAQELEASAKRNQAFQQVFGQTVERYPVLEEVLADINLKASMWEARRDVTTITESWKDVLINDMPVKDWEAQVQKWFKTATRAERELPTNPGMYMCAHGIYLHVFKTATRAERELSTNPGMYIWACIHIMYLYLYMHTFHIFARECIHTTYSCMHA